MKRKTLVIIVTVTMAVMVGLVAQQQHSGQREPLAANKGDSLIIAKLQEMVAIREAQFQEYEMLEELGKAPMDSCAGVNLAEVRIKLAREQGRPEAILQALRGLVAAHERRVKRIQDRARQGEFSPGIDEKELKFGLLEAEVRLLKAQQ